MSQWAPVKLKEVCTQVTVGFVGSMADEYCDEGIPFLRSLNIQPFRINTNDLKYIPQAFHERIRKSTLRPGDVGIVRTGYPGTACVIPAWLEEANCSDLVIVRPGPALNPHFLAAVFNSSFGRDLVGGNLVGAAQQHFNVTVAKELKLLLPPRKEQDKIAAILSAYDDLIANNQRRIALLEGMAEEIYREWFVRMRFPGHVGARYVAGLPEGWTQRRLSEVAEINARSVKRESEPEFIRYIDISAVGTNQLEMPEEIPFAEAPGRARRVVRSGDILWSSVRPGNKAYCVVVTAMENLVASTGFAVISPRPDTPYTYLHLATTTQNFVDQMVAVAKGSAYPAAAFDDFGRALIIWPAQSLLAQFHAVCEPIYEQLDRLRSVSRQLASQRDALLPRLISGKLKVDHLDIRLPPSMRAEAETTETTA